MSSLPPVYCSVCNCYATRDVKREVLHTFLVWLIRSPRPSFVKAARIPILFVIGEVTLIQLPFVKRAQLEYSLLTTLKFLCNPFRIWCRATWSTNKHSLLEKSARCCARITSVIGMHSSRRWWRNDTFEFM